MQITFKQQIHNYSSLSLNRILKKCIKIIKVKPVNRFYKSYCASKSKHFDYLKQQPYRHMLTVAFPSIIPFIAMQLTEEVNRSPLYFVAVAGQL